MDEKRKDFLDSIRINQDHSKEVIEAKKIIYPHYKVKNGIDGIAHIEHVTHLGTKVGLEENKDDIYSIILGCLLHDVGRKNEILEQTHGEAGGPIAKQILQKYFDKYNVDVDKVVYAIINHDKGKITSDRTIGSIWDADRLSLYRFAGREVDKDRLSTEAAKEMTEYAKKFINENMDEYLSDFEKDIEK